MCSKKKCFVVSSLEIQKLTHHNWVCLYYKVTVLSQLWCQARTHYFDIPVTPACVCVVFLLLLFFVGVCVCLFFLFAYFSLITGTLIALCQHIVPGSVVITLGSHSSLQHLEKFPYLSLCCSYSLQDFRNPFVYKALIKTTTKTRIHF